MDIRFKVFYEEGLKWVHDQSEIKLAEVTDKICEVIREADCMALAAGVPQEFIDAFRLEQKNIVIALLDHFERIMASESLTNNNKENALLDVALNAINLMILDTEKTLKRMELALWRDYWSVNRSRRDEDEEPDMVLRSCRSTRSPTMPSSISLGRGCVASTSTATLGACTLLAIAAGELIYKHFYTGTATTSWVGSACLKY